MKYAVTMPSLGADMDQGKLVEWRIKPGDVIAKGDSIAVVETTKAAVEIESFRSGKVLELIGKIDDTFPVGATLAWMEVADDGSGSTLSAPVVPTPASAAPAAAATPVTASPTASPAARGARRRVSPAARRLAEQHHLNVDELAGSGHDGAVELHDVEAAIAKAKPASPVTSSVAGSSSGINIRQAIGRAMSRSKREIPHYYLQSRCRVDALVNWLDQRNSHCTPEQRLFMPALLMYAVTQAAKQNPAFNGYYQNDAFVPSASIHLGVTVSLKPDGVMVPAILDAQDLSLAQLNTAFNDLVLRTRSNKLKNREITDGTLTVTNVGDLGADQVTGVIFPPQVAIVGFGRIHKAPVVDGDAVRVGKVLDVSLSADHRVSDGLAGSRFLQHILRLLEDPAQLDKH